MKMCILTTSFPRWNGDFAGSFVYDLAKKLVENGIEVRVVAPHDNRAAKFEVMDGMQVYRFQYMWPKSLQKLAYHGGIPHNFRSSLFSKIQSPFFILFFILKSLKIGKKSEIIHSHWALSGFIAALVKKLSNKPVILTIWGSDVPLLLNSTKIKRLPLEKILNEIDVITVAYDYEKSMIEHTFSSEKIIVIPVGVDVDRFRPEAREIDLKKRFNAEKDFLVINTRRFSKDYNVDVFVNAIPHVLKEIKNVKFILADSGPLKNNIENLTKRLKIQDSVIFLGGVPHEDMPKILATSDIYVDTFYQPGIQTRIGIGQATREAMACEVPQLLPDEIPKSADLEKHALLYKTLDSKNLADKILQLLTNEDLRKMLGKESRIIIKENYNIDKIIKKWIHIYERLVHK